MSARAWPFRFAEFSISLTCDFAFAGTACFHVVHVQHLALKELKMIGNLNLTYTAILKGVTLPELV